MVDLNSLVVDGCQPFDEGLLDEADMSEILGGNKDVSKTSIAKMYMPIALKILNRSLMLLAYKLCLYEIE